MKHAIRFPIRVKILVTLLFAITAVVSVIVLTMASLFHEDKKAYISDLVSMTSLSTAEECRAVLESYRERVRVYSRIAADADLTETNRSELLHSLFEDFPQLVAVSQARDGVELSSVVNQNELDRAQLTRADLDKWRSDHPLPPQVAQDGHPFIENSTVAPDLPTMTLSLRVADQARGGANIVSATIRLDELQRLTTRSEVFELFLAAPDGTLLADRDPSRVARREQADLRPEVRDLGKNGGAGLTVEYAKNGTDVIAGFADVRFGGIIAGARIPKTAAYLASRDLLMRLRNVALALLAAGAILGLVWARLITRPLDRLALATREIAAGRFDVYVDVASRDEFGDLSAGFNRMAGGLRERDSALRGAQDQLVQSEKMAAFGQLGAGIAHEVKNPLAGILGCAQIALRKAEPGTMLFTNLQLIEKETKRCKAIIDNLLKFARQEKASLEPTQVNGVVEDAVAIVNHQLEMNHTRLETDLAPGLPPILGNANQLQQVLMNLMINAQQAMEGNPGQVSIVTRVTEAGAVEIRVRDTGPGIPREIMERIFEPFFTTKPSGRGTGLGLSVSFGIVKDHGGEISVESVSGRGASFLITLPAYVVPVQPARVAVESQVAPT